jgi:UDPglucose 6-dehydrogenase
MNISVVGTGYVGLVAGACLADSGHHVICVDKDESKISRLQSGEVPIFEPGLTEIVQRNQKTKRLAFTTNLTDAVKHGKIIFIAVGTPEGPNGEADLSSILNVAATIGQEMDGYRLVVMKSTVPVGTHNIVSQAIRKHTPYFFDYVSNPEFLKEGTAIEDFTRPDRVVLGSTSEAAIETMREVYASFMRRSDRILIMDPASAEITKYAANAMLAIRISFINEMGGLCEKYGADIEQVRRGIGSDSRIGNAFLYPGVGYGGSCFPKDVNALISMGKAVDFHATLAAAAQEINIRQRCAFAYRVIYYFKSSTKPTPTLAIWGLAFKAWTDDVRESPAIDAIEMFTQYGFKVRVNDPEAMPKAKIKLGSTVTYCDDAYETLEGADALIVFTDWPQYRTPDFDLIFEKLHKPVIFDGRNLYDPAMMARRGFKYMSVGRPTVGVE